MTYHLPSGEARIATTGALWWSASRLTSSNVKDISNFSLVQPLDYLRHCNKQHQLEFCSLFLSFSQSEPAGLGLGGLVRLGTVPPYHCTKHFV